MANKDGDWKPNGRPQSTVARNFSASLNDAFAMDNNLDGLVQAVEQKKQAVSSQNAELEALEARIRETEQRLKEKQSGASFPAGRAAGVTNSPHRRQPLGDTFSPREGGMKQQGVGSSPLAGQAPAPATGTVSSSTMSYWRQGTQADPPESHGNSRDIPAEQLSGQTGSRYTQ